MKIIADEKKIKRNIQFGNYIPMVGMTFLVASAVLGFSPNSIPGSAWITPACLLLGFIFTQIGFYFINRYGRRPPMHEAITTSLKGLTKDYTLYHYITPVSHLLVGPAGVWVLESYYQYGNIVYEKDRWKQKGGGFLMLYLRLFAQEGLGRPDIEVKLDLETIKKELEDKLGEPLPLLNAALVFTDPRAVVDAENAPYPTVKVDNLKNVIRQQAKINSLTPEQIKKITDVLPQETMD